MSAAAAKRQQNGGPPVAAGRERPRGGSIFESSQLWTAEQVAKVLQVPKSWVYEQARAWVESDGSRGIPTVALGKYRRFRPATIRGYVDERERGGKS